MEKKCKKCGGSNIYMNAEGFSRKKNKPFRGPKCMDCGTWNFDLKDAPQRKEPQANLGQNIIDRLMRIEKLLATVIQNQTGKPHVTDDELKPDEEIPF